jgi:hypothetical protein
VALAFFGLFFCLCFFYLAITLSGYTVCIALISLFAGKARRKVPLFILDEWTGASIVSDLTRTTRTANLYNVLLIFDGRDD